MKEVILIKKVILSFVLFTSIVGVLYSGYALFDYFNEYRVSAQKNETLQSIHSNFDENKHEQLHNINTDYIGWLQVNGTEVNYPVVHGNDNDYYLTHNFYQEKDHVGAIFMDYRQSGDVLDDHTIIYGHNMKDNSMFASLSNILESDTFTNHTIEFEYLDHFYEWEVFSAYTTQQTDWMKLDFSIDNEYDHFLEQLQNKSVHKPDTNVRTDDKVITLATCTSRVSDERVVIHAKLKKESHS